jgi:hypothetical protein
VARPRSCDIISAITEAFHSGVDTQGSLVRELLKAATRTSS